tara:strand:+ start:681 stop:1241 length:561 start_codon:yes stop_codon:yes gene_type:complete
MKRNEKGFALPVSLLLLVVMTLMGATLLSITVGDIRANNEIDYSQQAFYAAESGITNAKKYLKTEKTLTPQGDPNNKLKFCKTNFFPNLRPGTVKAINNYIGIYNLDQLITATGDEKKRLSNFSFEYFITYSPDQNGYTSSAMKKPGTNKTFYTIHVCGCDASHSNCRSQNNKIVSLEAVVTLATQ